MDDFRPLMDLRHSPGHRPAPSDRRAASASAWSSRATARAGAPSPREPRAARKMGRHPVGEEGGLGTEFTEVRAAHVCAPVESNMCWAFWGEGTHGGEFAFGVEPGQVMTRGYDDLDISQSSTRQEDWHPSNSGAKQFDIHRPTFRFSEVGTPGKKEKTQKYTWSTRRFAARWARCQARDANPIVFGLWSRVIRPHDVDLCRYQGGCPLVYINNTL